MLTAVCEVTDFSKSQTIHDYQGSNIQNDE